MIIILVVKGGINLNYTNSKVYKAIYKLLNISERIIFLIIGTLLPIQLAWVTKEKPFSAYLTEANIEQFSSIFKFSAGKMLYYLDNLIITLATIFIIFIFRFTVKLEKNTSQFKIIEEFSICCTFVIIFLGLIKNN